MASAQKRSLLDQLIAKLQHEADTLISAAKAAHEAATHEESRSEDKHDTRGLEASYLAGAQADRAAQLQTLISAYRMMALKDFDAGDPVAPGALVELVQLETERRSRYLVVERGGGATLSMDGQTVQVIGPQSPLGEAMMGRRVDEEFEVEAQGGVREYKVQSIQ